MGLGSNNPVQVDTFGVPDAVSIRGVGFAAFPGSGGTNFLR